MIIEVLKIIRIVSVIGVVVLSYEWYTKERINREQQRIFWNCPTKQCYLAKDKVSKITHL
tara:strand:- start:393 stop:572 length:180 start_codon:yes stop_codon:yes gene_type:complete